MDYKQAVTNEDGELLGFDYHYDDEQEDWESRYDGRDDYDDEPPALDGFPHETDLDQEWL